MSSVVQYSPTPVLRSSAVETVVTLKVTQTVPTFWLESTGSAWRSTEKTEYRTIGGGVSGPSEPQPQPQPQPHNPQPAPAPQQPGQAWTHVGGGSPAATHLPCGDAHCVQGGGGGGGWQPAAGGQPAGSAGSLPPYLSGAARDRMSWVLVLMVLGSVILVV